MKSSRVEQRTWDVTELRVEPAADAEPSKIVGYAAIFDALSQPMMGFREVIRRGAFRQTIKDGDIRALWNHDANFVLGRKQANTLSLTEDDKGLRVSILPPDTSWANDLMTSIERGDVSQMSFGFRAVKDKWSGQETGKLLRELLAVQLFDVSPVTFPAYPQTEVSTRSLLMNLGISSEVIVESLNLSPDQLGAFFKMQVGCPLLSDEDRAAAESVREAFRNYFRAEPEHHHSEERQPEPEHHHSGDLNAGAGTSHSKEAPRDLRGIRLRLQLQGLI